MKLNVSFPATGCQKLIDLTDEIKSRIFYNKRIGAEVSADPLGEEWQGYVLRITGGNDRQGFPMMQGVLTSDRVRLLLSADHSCFRPRKEGQRRRKSVRGCIVDNSLSVLSLTIVRKGAADIPGLTDTSFPRRLGPKRANRIRKLFNLTKDDDVRQYVIRRVLPQRKEGEKKRTKAPKIQRLITPLRLQRRRHIAALKKKRILKNKQEVLMYNKILSRRKKETKHKLKRSSTSSLVRPSHWAASSTSTFSRFS